MNQISECCSYRVINNHDENKHVECRSMMTSITIKFEEDDKKSEEELLRECKIVKELYIALDDHNTRLKSENCPTGILWDILGYTGYMFFTEWLVSGYKYIMSDEDQADKKLVMNLYVQGMKLIIEETDRYCLNRPT